MKKLLCIIVVEIMVTGCVISPTPDGDGTDSALQETRTVTATVPGVFTTETPVLSLTPTPLSTSTSIMTSTQGSGEICPSIKAELEPNHLARGTIIFNSIVDGDLYALHSGDRDIQQFLSQLPCCLYTSSENVSPDHRWLAISNEKPNPQQGTPEVNLVLTTSNEQEKLIIPWDKQWSYSIIGWLDHQRLIIKPMPKESTIVVDPNTGQPGLFYTPEGVVILVNPFIGEQQVLSPSFPYVFEKLDPHSGWNYGTPSYVFYDSTLTRVVYVYDNLHSDSAPLGLALVLWNLETKQELWRHSLSHLYLRIPLDKISQPSWSPDGKQFAVAVPMFDHRLPAVNTEDEYQLLLISRDGQVERIYSPLLSRHVSYLGGFTWSPDGRFLSFGVVDPESGQFLLWDTVNQEIVDYCIVRPTYDVGLIFPYRSPFRPVWSPDGQQFLLTLPSNPEDIFSGTYILLVDVVKHELTRFFESDKVLYPVAWLVAEP